jgi:hypothetical protein
LRDWTEQNRTIWLGTLGRGEDIADPDVGHVVTDHVPRAVALLAAHHADIADDSPGLLYGLECWTGLNRGGIGLQFDRQPARCRPTCLWPGVRRVTVVVVAVRVEPHHHSRAGAHQ